MREGMWKWLVVVALVAGVGCDAEGAAEAEGASPQGAVATEEGAASDEGGEGAAKAAGDAEAGAMAPEAVVEAQGVGNLADVVYVGDGDVYAVSGEQPKLARFAVRDGSLAFVDAYDLGTEAAGWNIVVLDQGKSLWVRTGGIASSGGAVVFERDPKTGELTKKGGATLPDDMSEDVASPDGKFLYTAQGRGNVIGIYRRVEDAFGDVEKMEFVTIDGAEVSTTSGSSAMLAMGPEGKFVYATSDKAYDADRKMLADYRLYVFERDPETGKLSQVAFYEHDTDGVELPRQPKSLAVSPDSERVWVGGSAGIIGGEVAVFDRDASTGKLSFVGLEKFTAADYVKSLGDKAPAGAVPASMDAAQDGLYVVIEGTPAVARVAR